MINPGLREALNRVRVRSGSFLAIAVLVLARPTSESLVHGALAAAAGLLIRAWASGHLRKEKALAVSGPYRYSRNPLYLGNFVIGAGLVLTARSWWVLALFAAYFGIFYPLIITRERDRMRRLFPEEYEDVRAAGAAFPPLVPQAAPRRGRPVQRAALPAEPRIPRSRRDRRLLGSAGGQGAPVESLIPV